MKKIKIYQALLILLIAITTLTACSTQKITRGNLIRDSLIDKIILGESTKENIINILGSPTATSSFNNNTWYYIGQRKEKLAFYPPQTKEVRIFAMTFNNNIIQKIQELDKQNITQISYNNNRTITKGSEITVVQQLFGNLGKFKTDTNQQNRIRDLLAQ